MPSSDLQTAGRPSRRLVVNWFVSKFRSRFVIEFSIFCRCFEFGAGSGLNHKGVASASAMKSLSLDVLKTAARSLSRKRGISVRIVIVTKAYEPPMSVPLRNESKDIDATRSD